jgi:Williams-Beuren syndrome DDT (WSD), D-TOX E motif
LNDLEALEKEAEITREHNIALAESFVRTEPLGVDRYFRRYWSFDGDEKLWVEERIRVGCEGGVTSAAPPAAQGKSAKDQLAEQVRSQDGSICQLENTRPSLWVSKWSLYASVREQWALREALDDRGVREKALKQALVDRFDIEEPPKRPEYLMTGHEFLGRHVLRWFPKVCGRDESGGGHAQGGSWVGSQ